MATATRKKTSRKTSSRKSPQQAAAPFSPTNKTQTLLVVLLIVVSFFSGYLFFKLRSLEQGANLPNQAQLPQQATTVNAAKPDYNADPWRGPKNARIVWVEYSDLECPFCKSAHPNISKLLEDYPSQVAWVFRHYPLSFHPKAQKSAEAVECARNQGGSEAFWKMTDTIYEKMPDVELSQLPSIAAEVGLNQSEFQQCLDSGKFAQKVKDELAQGTKEGVQATPTSVVFDMKTGKSTTVEGAVPYEQMKQTVDQILSQN